MRKNILVVAAHPDDEVLGCGGSIARWKHEGFGVHLLLLADGVSSRGTVPADVDQDSLKTRIDSMHRACEILGIDSVTSHALPDNRLDTIPLLDIVKIIDETIKIIQPFSVLSHHAGDVNIDHRIVHDAVIAACRPVPQHPVSELLFFEVPSSTEWHFSQSAAFCPNYFIDVTKHVDTKLAALNAYRAELREFPHPRSIAAVTALMAWRGATVGVKAAEAFMLGRKTVLSDSPFAKFG